MPRCAYCSGELKRGTGMMFVYRSGDIAYYCSNSCFKNHKVLGRKINKKLLVKEIKVEKTVATKK